MSENHPLAPEPRVPGATRIMGIDPGLTRCGISMLDMTADRKAYFVNVGIAGTQAAEALDQRILRIFTAAQQWIKVYKPDALAIERIFAQEQVNTVIGTAHASGAVISAAAMLGVPVHFHTPSEVKAAVTGRILGLEKMPKPADAADALAIAICHGWRGGGIGSGINMAAHTQTHQGSQPVQAARGAALTPAQRAWKEAEAKARR